MCRTRGVHMRFKHLVSNIFQLESKSLTKKDKELLQNICKKLEEAQKLDKSTFENVIQFAQEIQSLLEQSENIAFKKLAKNIADEINEYNSTFEEQKWLIKTAEETKKIPEYVRASNFIIDLQSQAQDNKAIAKSYYEGVSLAQNLLTADQKELYEKKDKLAPIFPSLFIDQQDNNSKKLILLSNKVTEAFNTKDISNIYNALVNLSTFIQDLFPNKDSQQLLADLRILIPNISRPTDLSLLKEIGEVIASGEASDTILADPVALNNWNYIRLGLGCYNGFFDFDLDVSETVDANALPSSQSNAMKDQLTKIIFLGVDKTFPDRAEIIDNLIKINEDYLQSLYLEVTPLSMNASTLNITELKEELKKNQNPLVKDKVDKCEELMTILNRPDLPASQKLAQYNVAIDQYRGAIKKARNPYSDNTLRGFKIFLKACFIITIPYMIYQGKQGKAPSKTKPLGESFLEKSDKISGAFIKTLQTNCQNCKIHLLHAINAEIANASNNAITGNQFIEENFINKYESITEDSDHWAIKVKLESSRAFKIALASYQAEQRLYNTLIQPGKSPEEKFAAYKNEYMKKETQHALNSNPDKKVSGFFRGAGFYLAKTFTLGTASSSYFLTKEQLSRRTLHKDTKTLIENEKKERSLLKKH